MMAFVARDESEQAIKPPKQIEAAGEHSVNNIRTDIWRLIDYYTLPQAAALIANIDPCAIEYKEASKSLHLQTGMPNDIRVGHANIVFTLLVKKIKKEYAKWAEENQIEKIPLKKQFFVDWLIRTGQNPKFFSREIERTRAHRSAMRNMKLHERIMEETRLRRKDYLDPENPRYAPKLAAAIRAWQAVEDPKGKHPAQAIREWLTRNAKELGLLKDDGKPNKSAIEDIAKIANWQPKGGAPKTPG